MQNVKLKTGFTLIEVLAVVSIMLIVCAMAVPAFYHFQQRIGLDEAAREIIGSLRLASQRAAAGQGDSPWGVYFDIIASTQKYVLFKGVNYLGRDIAFDQSRDLPSDLEIFSVNLADAGQEAVFQKINGQTSQTGQIALRLKAVPSDNRVIFIEGSCETSLALAVVDDSARLKDSRHIHFAYNRTIDILTEKIILTFNGSVIKQIDFAGNMAAGQLFWQGEVQVGADDQKISIQTLRLNNPDTLFCVYRDRRYNNVGLAIDIDGDVNYPAFSPVLIGYSAAGLVTQGSSAVVSVPIWQ